MQELRNCHILQCMNITAPNADLALRSGPDEGALVAVLEAAEELHERLEAALAAVGLSLSKFDAMDQLVRAGEPMTLGSLAGRLHCVRSNVTQLVDRLEAEGFVQRGGCSEDRRAIRACVTPLGAERHAAGLEAIRSVQARVAERLAPADRARLLDLLAALTR